MKTKTANKSAFTLVEIMIVVAIIGLLAAIAIPNFVRARSTAQTNACINNLRQIDGAKQQWAMENRAQGGVVPTDVQIGSYLGRSATTTNVVCPSGGLTATFTSSYDILEVSNAPLCKILGVAQSGNHVLP